MKKEHKKKMIAPIVIGIIFVLYYIVIGIVYLKLPNIPAIVKLLLAVIPAALAGVAVYVVAERIKEIRSGEEDDLSKY